MRALTAHPRLLILLTHVISTMFQKGHFDMRKDVDLPRDLTVEDVQTVIVKCFPDPLRADMDASPDTSAVEKAYELAEFFLEGRQGISQTFLNNRDQPVAGSNAQNNRRNESAKVVQGCPPSS